jgi:hypothetical protein
VLLRQQHFHPAKILPVARNHDLAANVHFQLLEFLEVLRRPVVRIHHFRLDVTRRGHAAERRHDSRVILVGIGADMFPRRAMHVDAGWRGQIHADLHGIIHPDLILRELRFQSRFAEFLRNVIRRRFVLGRSRHMGRLGQRAQMLFRQRGIRDLEKYFLRRQFRGRIVKPKDLRRGRRFVAIARARVHDVLCVQVRVIPITGIKQQNGQTEDSEKFHRSPLRFRRAQRRNRQTSIVTQPPPIQASARPPHHA